MENNLFRKPTPQTALVNKYEYLGLKQNPFPYEPAVKPYSKDDRENGSIFLTDLRKSEIDQFKEIIVKQPMKIYLLMDYAAYRGRGIGKTAFLNYEKKQINIDLGDKISGGEQVLFSIYVSPGGEKKERKFWQIARLIYKAMNDEELILMAFCRLRAMSKLLDDKILKKINYNNLSETIGSDTWLKENKVPIEELNKDLTSTLKGIGIEIDLRNVELFKDTFDFFKDKLCSDLSDNFWRKSGVDLVFNTLVKLLKKAYFSHCIILFDEAEKLITAQNFSERREFCDNLRYFFVDGINENVNQSFFKILMTIHPNSQELLLTHWNASGLERFSELGGDKAKHNTIFFNPLKDIQLGIALAKEYINHAKNSSSDSKDLSPFTKEALEIALEKAEGIPGKYLKLLFNSVEKAVSEGWKEIGKEQIEKIWKTVLAFENQGQENQHRLPETKTNLNE